jgi:hypothetical protein
MTSQQKFLFLFVPTFEKIEDFLKAYQKLDDQKNEQVIELQVRKEYWTTTPGYPDIERNCWLTLKYAVDQMERSFLIGKSKVKIQLQCRELE